MSNVVIAGAARTAIGAFGGGLSSLSAAELGEIAIREALSRAGTPADAVDEVILGQVLTAAAGMNPARQAAVARFAAPACARSRSARRRSALATAKSWLPAVRRT